MNKIFIWKIEKNDEINWYGILAPDLATAKRNAKSQYNLTDAIVNTIVEQNDNTFKIFTINNSGQLINLVAKPRLNNNPLQIVWENAFMVEWNRFAKWLKTVKNYSYIKNGIEIFINDIFSYPKDLPGLPNNEQVKTSAEKKMIDDGGTNLQERKGVIGDPRWNTNDGRVQFTNAILSFYNTNIVPKITYKVLTGINDFGLFYTPKPIDTAMIASVQFFNSIVDTSIQIDGWLGSQTSQLFYPSSPIAIGYLFEDLTGFLTDIGEQNANTSTPPVSEAGSSSARWQILSPKYQFGNVDIYEQWKKRNPSQVEQLEKDWNSRYRGMAIFPTGWVNILNTIDFKLPGYNGPIRPPGYYGRGIGKYKLENQWISFKSTLRDYEGMVYYTAVKFGSIRFVMTKENQFYITRGKWRSSDDVVADFLEKDTPPFKTAYARFKAAQIADKPFVYYKPYNAKTIKDVWPYIDLYTEENNGNDPNLWFNVLAGAQSRPAFQEAVDWLAAKNTPGDSLDISDRVAQYKKVLGRLGNITSLKNRVNNLGFVR